MTRSYGPPKRTKAYMRLAFDRWLASCRDVALDWPVDSLARSYGMKETDVNSAVLGEKLRRSVRGS